MRASFVKIPARLIALPAFGLICTLGVPAQQSMGNASSSTATKGGDFVQEGIRITPPVTRETDTHGKPVLWIYHDGGTRHVRIRDAKGRSFDVFIDHRISATTPGAIYLNAYPGETDSVRVVHPDEFRQEVGDFDDDFVQEGIRIAAPVARQRDNHGQPILWIYNDGGTRRVPIRDAKGRSFDIFIDHKISTTTPGAIYLNAYPGETNSVRVLHPDEFRQKVGDFDK